MSRDALVVLSPGEERLTAVERRLARERAARREAEEIAERTTRALYDKQHELMLFEAVVSGSNESSTVEEALQGAVDAVCAHTSWPVGHVYIRSRSTGELRPTTIWHFERPTQFAAFRRKTERTILRDGIGLPGRVLATGGATWMTDAEVDADFHRQGFGIRAAFAFPVHAAGEVMAVLEFFNAVPVAPDAPLLEVMTQIGRHLGRAVERIQANEQLSHQATHDALTGLPNRVLLRDRLEHALARAQRHGTAAAVLFLDLDRFKDVNDTLGHSVGDRLLTDVADRLQEALRGCDTVTRVGEEEFTLARFGGDEFVVLCEDLASEAAAVRIAERIRQVLRRPFVLEDQDHVVTASIGIVLATGAGEDAEALLRDADIAMYRAKARGSGQWEIFDEGLRRRALERVAMEQGLRRALETGELRLHYQPIVTLRNERICAVEALVRWQHPERGLVPPGDFIPIAEESGLILLLGAWTLWEACRQASLWRAELGDLAPLPVSVNVSARQLAQAELPALVRQVLAETGVPAADLAIEITETALIEESSVPEASLRELKALGVRILLDDFGTGYSSLAHLDRFPIDALKIDRSFVQRLGAEGANGGNGATVRAITAMARAFDLDVVAEGVESAEQAAEARALGCGLAQGYRYARPAPAAEIAALVREQRDAGHSATAG